MTLRRFFFATLIFIFPAALHAENRTTWEMDESYEGQYPDSYRSLLNEIPILMRQTLIDIAGKIGLNYQDGWANPLTVGFTDTVGWGAENILAYVQLFKTDVGIAQELRVNLGAYEHQKFDFEKVFAHELTHAMLNDALGGSAASVIPPWFHEGLAVYAADQGEKMLKSYVYSNSGFAAERLLNGLDSPHGALDYAEDYLAFRYIESRYGSLGIHSFVREVINRQGNIPAALDYTLHETWSEFQQHVKEFGAQEIKDIGPAKRGQHEKPY